MLEVSDLSKRYADNLLFEHVSFTLNVGERVALIGPNGCGKTTLLRILIGVEPPDSGSVRHASTHVTVGYLPQALEIAEGSTVHDVLADDPSLVAPSADQVQLPVNASSTQAGRQASQLERDDAARLERMALASNRLPEHTARQVLAGLGLADVSPETPARTLSGGQKTRLGLARLLLQNPSVLLLDEPTNHLDIDGLRWLESYLGAYRGALLVVSHDRTFLDHTVTRVLEMDPQRCTVTLYEGNYSAYVLTKERARQRHWQAFKEQEERISRLEDSMRALRGQAQRIEGESLSFYYRKRAKKVARQAVVRSKRIQRILDSEEHLDKPQSAWRMKLDLGNTPSSGDIVLSMDDLGKRYGSLVLFEHADLTLRRGERVALVGPNGCGKTTLLRILAGQELATDGLVRLGANVRVGHLAQEQDNLDWDLTPYEIVRGAGALGETDARSFLHYFLFAGDDVFQPVNSLSFGERARLALGILVLQGCNLLLLDEPINHLDIPSRDRFERALAQFDGTVIAVVHDRYFVEHYATVIWAIEARRLVRYVDWGHLMRRTVGGSELEPDLVKAR